MVDLYRTKAEHYEIEANQVTPENVIAVAIWCGGTSVVEHDAMDHSQTFAAINVPTPTGMKRAQEDDYVVREPTGGFVVYKPSQFEHLFERVRDLPHD